MKFRFFQTARTQGLISKKVSKAQLRKWPMSRATDARLLRSFSANQPLLPPSARKPDAVAFS